MDGIFQRGERLLGKEIMNRLASTRVIVFGVGGVGSWCAEGLVRLGIGKLTIVDSDCVSVTNINRQLMATTHTVGQPKVDVLRERLLAINPNAEITAIQDVYCAENAESFRLGDYDYVIDAIDTLSPKLALIKGALDRNIPLVSSMGAGAKLDPTKMEICDISKTHHCPLAHMLRKRLHKMGIRRGFKAVFSAEPPIEGAMILCQEQNKKSNVGTISYIPALFGIGCASVVVRSLIGEF